MAARSPTDTLPDVSVQTSADTVGEPVRRVPRQRRKQHERREEAERRILDTALELVSEKGVAGMTLNEAGERAGYSRALPAHHYGNKEGLLIALVQHIEATFRAARVAADRWKPGIESLLGVVGLYIDRAVTHDAASRALHILFTEGFVCGGPLAQALDEFNQHSLVHLEEQIRIALHEKQVRQDIDPGAEAVVILGALRGISAQFLLGRPAADATQVRDSLLRTIERGLLPMP